MARFVEDNSAATLFVAGSLNSLLPANALARVVRAALAGVWITALLRGVTSSVMVARLCEEDIKFRWLLGNAPARKSTLCDFRKRHVEALAAFSTQVLAALPVKAPRNRNNKLRLFTALAGRAFIPIWLSRQVCP